jgi:hypothetical protein
MSSMPGENPADPARRKPSPRRQVRYDDDFDIGQPMGGDNASSIGVIGLVFALVSIGLLAVVAVLFIFLKQEEQLQLNADRKRWMLYWFLLLDALSFFASIVAIVLASRGLTPSNPLYRGWSLMALILGMIEVGVTLLFGIFMTCAVMIFEAFNGR